MHPTAEHPHPVAGVVGAHLRSLMYLDVAREAGRAAAREALERAPDGLVA
jgi:hypothetical protein